MSKACISCGGPTRKRDLCRSCFLRAEKFGDPAVSDQRGQRDYVPAICSLCPRQVVAKDLCERHYRSLLHHGDPLGEVQRKGGRLGSDDCKTERCPFTIYKSGLCYECWVVAWPPCSVEACPKRSWKDGLCERHHKINAAYGSPTAEVPRRVCATEGCSKVVVAKGLCSACYQQTVPAEVQRDYHLKKKFGISHAEYERILAGQGGRCAICRTDDPGGSGRRRKSFAVDHDHATGVVRGLLCGPCNTALGLFGDDPDRLGEARVYLLSHRPS